MTLIHCCASPYYKYLNISISENVLEFKQIRFGNSFIKLGWLYSNIEAGLLTLITVIIRQSI